RDERSREPQTRQPREGVAKQRRDPRLVRFGEKLAAGTEVGVSPQVVEPLGLGGRVSVGPKLDVVLHEFELGSQGQISHKTSSDDEKVELKGALRGGYSHSVADRFHGGPRRPGVEAE